MPSWMQRLFSMRSDIFDSALGWCGGVSAWERFQATLRASLGPPLKHLQEPVDAWLGRLPMWVAMTCAVGLYVVALIWTWLLPREFIFRGAPDQARGADLRIWATVVILPYIAVYLWLGR